MDMDAMFAALADPTRRGVIERLRRRPHRAGELAEALGVSALFIRRHLRVLRKTGLVVEEHEGDDARVRVYRLRREPFGALRRWLDEVEAYWSRQLDAFKAHAERTRGKGKEGAR